MTTVNGNSRAERFLRMVTQAVHQSLWISGQAGGQEGDRELSPLEEFFMGARSIGVRCGKG